VLSSYPELRLPQSESFVWFVNWAASFWNLANAFTCPLHGSQHADPFLRTRRANDVLAKQSCWWVIEMNGLIMHLSNDREHVVACNDIPQSLQPQGGYIYHVAQYMFATGCWSDNVDQLTKFIGFVVTMEWCDIPPHHRGHVKTWLAVAPIHTTDLSPPTTGKFVGCTSPRMTSHPLLLYSAHFLPLNLRTNVQKFLRRGSKRICPMSQLWGMSKIPASAVNYELLAKFSSVSFPR
jgi:hypothetical protein